MQIITLTQLEHVQAISKITMASFIKTYQNEELRITKEIITEATGNLEDLITGYTKKINQGKNDLSFVYIENGNVLGHIWGKQKSENQYSIETLYIEPKNVKHGVGGTLLSTLLDKIYSINPNAEIILVVAKMNKNAIGFYQHFGFKIANQEFGKYKINNEINIDTVLMIKNRSE